MSGEPVLHILIRDCEIITAHNVGGACAHCTQICLAFNGDHFYFYFSKKREKIQSITDSLANSHTIKNAVFPFVFEQKYIAPSYTFIPSFSLSPPKRFSFRWLYYVSLFSFLPNKPKLSYNNLIFFLSLTLKLGICLKIRNPLLSNFEFYSRDLLFQIQ